MDMEFKDRLEQAINRTGKTQNEIVSSVKLMPGGEKFTQQTLSSLVVGRTKASSYVAHLAKACQVDPFWLASGENAQPIDISSSNTVNEDTAPYGLIINDEIREVVEYIVSNQLKEYYSKLPPAAQVKLIFELYSTAYKDRALLTASKHMQPSTLLKMVNS